MHRISSASDTLPRQPQQASRKASMEASAMSCRQKLRLSDASREKCQQQRFGSSATTWWHAKKPAKDTPTPDLRSASSNEGRNLLFLRGTPNPDQYDATVPIFETAIHLADKNPYQRSDEGQYSTRLVITRELEGALVQFGDTNLSYMDYLIDFLGTQDGIVELSRLSSSVPIALQRDIAVGILLRGRADMQSEVISLLLDTSAPGWKRGNAASALGEHGTDAAVRPLQDIASQPDASLRRSALEALSKIAARHQVAEAPTKVP